MNKCNEKGNYNGNCCCNCKHRAKVVKHPNNAKGSVTEVMGFVCCINLDNGSVVFNDNEHGTCELHEVVATVKKTWLDRLDFH